MPRGEQIAKPTERAMRLAGRFFCGAIPSALTTSAAPIHPLPEAGTMFKRLLVLGPSSPLASPRPDAGRAAQPASGPGPGARRAVFAAGEARGGGAGARVPPSARGHLYGLVDPLPPPGGPPPVGSGRWIYAPPPV